MVIFCGVLLGGGFEFVYNVDLLHQYEIQHLRKYQSRSDDSFCSGGFQPAVSSVSCWFGVP